MFFRSVISDPGLGSVAAALAALLVAACAAPTTSPAGPPAARPSPELTIPVARGYHVMAGLGPSLGVWLFGGSTGVPAFGGQVLADTWTHRSSGWIRVGLEAAPAFSDASLLRRPVATVADVAYSGRAGRVILLTISEPEIWLYDPNADRWEKRPAGQRPALHGSRAAFDSESDRVIVFTRSGETWAYDLGANSWTKKAPQISPPPRAWGGMAYDEGSDRVILFGGEAGIGLGDTWAYDFNSDSWKDMTPAKSPPARYYTAMAYEPRSDRIILFGGVAIGSPGFFPPQERDVPELSPLLGSEKPRDDTWAYDFDKNTWTALAPATAPGPRAWHAMAHDGKGNVVLFGGGLDRDHYQADTWTYDLTQNTWSPVR